MITRLSSDLGNVDGLSRMPMPTDSEGEYLCDVSLYNVSQIETISVTMVDFYAIWPLVEQSVLLFTKGWPSNCFDSLKPFWLHRNELFIEKGCILWGMRVFVPMAWTAKSRDVMELLQVCLILLTTFTRLHQLFNIFVNTRPPNMATSYLFYYHNSHVTFIKHF